MMCFPGLKLLFVTMGAAHSQGSTGPLEQVVLKTHLVRFWTDFWEIVGKEICARDRKY